MMMVMTTMMLMMAIGTRRLWRWRRRRLLLLPPLQPLEEQGTKGPGDAPKKKTTNLKNISRTVGTKQKTYDITGSEFDTHAYTQHFGSSQRYTTLLTAGCSTWVPQESRKSCSFHDLLCASYTIEPTHDLWTTIRTSIIPHPCMFIARKEWHDVFVLAELVAHYHGDPAQSSPESNPKIIYEKQTWTCFAPNFYSSCTYTHLMNGKWQCQWQCHLPFSAEYHTLQRLLFASFCIFGGFGGGGGCWLGIHQRVTFVS